MTEAKLKGLRPQIAAIAQRVYDDWDQSDVSLEDWEAF